MKAKEVVVWFGSVFLMTLIIAAFGVWYMKPYEPESFQKGVMLLKKNKYIKSNIGSYSSHSWKHTELPEETDNPASFKVSFKGSDAEVFLTCIVSKNPNGVWKLDEIRQDSIKRF